MRTPGSCLLLATLALALGGCTGGVVEVEPGPPDAGLPDAGLPDPACDASCKALWSLDLGGSHQSTVTAVGADGWGNVIFVAVLEGAPNTLGVPTSASGRRVVLAKLDPAGYVLWTKVLGSASTAPLMNVGAGGSIVLFGTLYGGEVLDLGGGPLSPAGPGLSTMYVAELDASGDHVMSRALHEVTTDPSGNDNDLVLPTALAVAPTGAIVVGGDFVGPLNFGDGELGVSPPTPYAGNAFVVKLDASGALAWSQRLGRSQELNYSSGTSAGTVAVDAAGSIVLGLTLYGVVDELAGQTFTSAGHADILIAKLDPSGAPVFADQFGGPDFDFPGVITLGPDGAIYFAGQATGTVDFGGVPLANPSGLGGAFVTAIAPDGHVRWSVPGPALLGGFGGGIALDGAGSLVAAFADESPSTQLAVARFDPSNGATLATRTFALADPGDFGISLELQGFALDPLGNALLAGGFRGVVDFGSGPLTMYTMSDPLLEGQSAFLAKVAP
jgi:hypothetical protein